MKIYQKFFLFSLAITPITALSQFKHDIGLKLSSEESEQTQLEYRWHLNEKWAFMATASYGGVGNGFYFQQLLPGDSTFEAVSSRYTSRNYGLSVGATRKFSFMKHNFYYIGATVGGGYESTTFSTFEYIYEVDSVYNAYPPYYHSNGNPVETSSSEYNESSYSLISKVYLGVNVPILDHLAINFEGGVRHELSGISSSFVRNDLSYFGTLGFRYRFGKIE